MFAYAFMCKLTRLLFQLPMFMITVFMLICLQRGFDGYFPLCFLLSSAVSMFYFVTVPFITITLKMELTTVK